MLTRVPVLVAAAGAPWEASVLARLEAPGSGLVLLRRCLDLPDLLAVAATGQAAVALLAEGLPGLDADSLARLRHDGVGVVLVTEAGERSEPAPARPGMVRSVAADALDEVGPLLLAAASAAEEAVGPEAGKDADTEEQEWRDAAAATPGPLGPPERRGRVVAVWGPAGAPGRTTVAVALAAELAHRGRSAFLVDADPYGGAVSQHLGVLDEVSGLLAAARLANAGRLDVERLVTLGRQVGPQLRVLTGLPRPDRWTEVRDTAFERLLEVAPSLARHVVVDTGFSLEGDPADPFGSSAPQRNAMTTAALGQADEVLVVGAADPVGLARLARGLVELAEVVPGRPVRVAVNRTRTSLGWSESEVRGMIEGFVRPVGVHFLPDDRPAADRALVAGRTLVETGDSSLRRAVSGLADAVVGPSPEATRGRRWRPGGRRRSPRQAPNSR